MGWEYESDKVWEAQTLYCVERLSFSAVSQATGIASSTLKRWSEKYHWREKRNDIAEAEAELRINKVKARTVTLEALLNNPRADLAFAVSSLETLALKEETARKLSSRTPQQYPTIAINTPADAIKALKQAVEQRLANIVHDNTLDIFEGAQKIEKTLSLINKLEALQPETTSNAEAGLPAALVANIEAAMRGDG